MVIKNIESDFCIMDREDNGDKKLKKKDNFYLYLFIFNCHLEIIH